MLISTFGRAAAAGSQRGSAGLLLTADQGLTWVAKGHIVREDSWLIENSVVELPGDRLLQFFRTRLGVPLPLISMVNGSGAVGGDATADYDHACNADSQITTHAS